MKQWIYPETILRLKYQCQLFLNGDIDVVFIQSEIMLAENQIVAIEEKWLKDILFNAENQIELYVYTTNQSDLNKAVTPIIQDILWNIS
ncbi:MAG: hypothetical protein LBJ88_03890 [Campylobacteraceae bacterium]|jgi:hypothetical protein|nr:hypothetical protein [Campylobacteraceae bacterium]